MEARGRRVKIKFCFIDSAITINVKTRLVKKKIVTSLFSICFYSAVLSTHEKTVSAVNRIGFSRKGKNGNFMILSRKKN